MKPTRVFIGLSAVALAFAILHGGTAHGGQEGRLNGGDLSPGDIISMELDSVPADGSGPFLEFSVVVPAVENFRANVRPESGLVTSGRTRDLEIAIPFSTMKHFDRDRFARAEFETHVEETLSVLRVPITPDGDAALPNCGEFTVGTSVTLTTESATRRYLCNLDSDTGETFWRFIMEPTLSTLNGGAYRDPS